MGYDAANQLETSQDSTGTTTYQYGPAGNLQVTVAPPNQRTTNTWDGENRRTRVQLPGGVVDTSVYNGDGQRVQVQDSAARGTSFGTVRRTCWKPPPTV